VSLIVGCCHCLVGVVLAIIGFFVSIPSGLALLLAASTAIHGWDRQEQLRAYGGEVSAACAEEASTAP
jgi:hypothetical protein